MHRVGVPAPGVACAVLACALAGWTGCAGDGPRDGVVRRDSAGVRIVESQAPRWAEGGAWVVDPEPVLDLATSGQGAGHEFHRVRHATRLRDGRIAVADEGSNEIRMFGPDGAFHGKVGRTGDGPGEYRRLTSVHEIRGDSLLAFDSWLARFTLYDPQGHPVFTFNVPDANQRVWRAWPVGDSAIVSIRHHLEPIVEYGLYRVPYAIVKTDLRGDGADTLAILPGYEGFQFEAGDARPLFGRDGHMTARGDRIAIGDAETLQVTVLGLDGRIRHIARAPAFDLRVTPEEVRAERAAAVPSEDAPPFLREIAAQLPDPTTRPAYARLLLDPFGNVWAPEAHGRVMPDRPVRCQVFDADGRWLGEVVLPSRFTPFEVGQRYVLGVQVDEAGVEHVLLLRLTRE